MENANGSNWHYEFNVDVYHDLDQELLELRSMFLTLKVLDLYKGNHDDDDVANYAITAELEQMEDVIEGIVILYNQLAERIITPSESV